MYGRAPGLDHFRKRDSLDQLYRWRLLYTSRPGSASPIQRAFTGNETFKIFQEVQLAETGPCRVNNIVELGDDERSGFHISCRAVLCPRKTCSGHHKRTVHPDACINTCTSCSCSHPRMIIPLKTGSFRQPKWFQEGWIRHTWPEH